MHCRWQLSVSISLDSRAHFGIRRWASDVMVTCPSGKIVLIMIEIEQLRG